MDGIENRIWVSWLELKTAPVLSRQFPSKAICNRAHLDAASYLNLYARIGGRWQWDTRKKFSNTELQELLQSPASHVFTLLVEKSIIGICEFWGVASEFELQHFGLLPEWNGKGFGLAFLETALNMVWQTGCQSIWLHTDEWDSPSAIPVYEKVGFKVYKREFIDPECL